jgi:hypothetical protein
MHPRGQTTTKLGGHAPNGAVPSCSGQPVARKTTRRIHLVALSTKMAHLNNCRDQFIKSLRSGAPHARAFATATNAECGRPTTLGGSAGAQTESDLTNDDWDEQTNSRRRLRGVIDGSRRIVGGPRDVVVSVMTLVTAVTMFIGIRRRHA